MYGGNFCQNTTFANSLNTTVLSNFCVSPVTHQVDVSLNDVFSYVGFFFSTLDVVTGYIIRTTYGFMAGIIGLFLSSLCVIKVVCISSDLLLFSALIVFAETRNRAFPEDRCQAWRQRICLRQCASLLPAYRFFYFSPAVSYSILASFDIIKSSSHGTIFPSSGPYTNSYMLQVSVAFRTWLLGRFKG